MTRYADVETGEILDVAQMRRERARAMARARYKARWAGKRKARTRPSGWAKWWRQLAAHLGTILLLLTLATVVITMAK
jgi:hypothetical protein